MKLNEKCTKYIGATAAKNKYGRGERVANGTELYQRRNDCLRFVCRTMCDE